MSLMTEVVMKAKSIKISLLPTTFSIQNASKLKEQQSEKNAKKTKSVEI